MARYGISIVADSLECDAAIVWSVLWAGRMAGNRTVYEHYRSLGKPVIVIDVGTLNRGVTWKIGVNHINGLGEFAQKLNLDPNRPKQLGVNLQPPGARRKEILIACQHRNSLQMTGVDTEQWITTTYEQLKQHTDRPVVLRPHPRSPVAVDRLPRGLIHERPRQVPNTYDSFDFDTNYHAVINYSSGPGILAAIAGTPPVVHTSSLAYPVSISIEQIEQPYTIDRSQWLIEIAHTEYTIEEIASGLWLKRLSEILQIRP